MSETRAAYNVAMSHSDPDEGQPGMDLDIRVMRAIHRINVISYPTLAVYSEAIDSAAGDAPPFSTDPAVAMGAWMWMVKQGFRPQLKSDINEHLVTANYRGTAKTVASSDFCHAIALAILEAGKAFEVIE